jgi:hypothetical protein
MENNKNINNENNIINDRFIVCDCGKKFLKNNIKIHSISKRHVDFVNTGIVKPITRKEKLTEEEKKERKNQRTQRKIEKLIDNLV